MTFAPTFDSLTDDQLLIEIQRLATDERCATARLLSCLIEVDSRRLYLREGCSSLFTYCSQVLRLDESAAYNRIEVARAARRLPALLEAIADGSITLTSARLLAPHLTVENHAELLMAARQRSKREVEVLIAGLAPRPDVATVLRKLPVASRAVSSHGRMNSDDAPGPNQGTIDARSSASVVSGENANSTIPLQVGGSDMARAETPPTRRAILAPLSTETYKLQLTISAATHDKFGRARDLLRHSISDWRHGRSSRSCVDGAAPGSRAASMRHCREAAGVGHGKLTGPAHSGGRETRGLAARRRSLRFLEWYTALH